MFCSMLRYALLNKNCIICFSGYEKSSATERYEYKSREKGTREGLEKDIKRNLDILFHSISIQSHFVAFSSHFSSESKW